MLIEYEPYLANMIIHKKEEAKRLREREREREECEQNHIMISAVCRAIAHDRHVSILL